MLEIYYYLCRNRYLSLHTIKKGNVDQWQVYCKKDDNLQGNKDE